MKDNQFNKTPLTIFTAEEAKKQSEKKMDIKTIELHNEIIDKIKEKSNMGEYQTTYMLDRKQYEKKTIQSAINLLINQKYYVEPNTNEMTGVVCLYISWE